MSCQPLYLRPNVVAEPLVDRWYAWSHLVSPATAAMNIAHRHLKIMESFVNAPQVHVAAVANPKMLGGPFINYGPDRVPEIRALIAQTKQDRAQMLAFAGAIEELDDLLRAKADGHSLEPLYESIPEVLRGYVELVYDLASQPSFRLLEPLLYQSPFYEEKSQSLMLSLIDVDDRPFVLSTPRLDSSENVHVSTPFAATAIDDLFAMKRVPASLCWIKDRLRLADKDNTTLRTLFTTDPPPPYEPYAGDGVRWRYFGHACILIETSGISILTDPVLSYTFESNIPRYSYENLPDVIDYVLITHNHQDHIMFETILQLRHRIRCVVVPRSSGGSLQDPSLKLLLKRIGFRNVIELDEMETLDAERAAITGIPFLGEHADLDIRSKLAYLVRIGKHSMIFAADSCNLESRLYEYVQKVTGSVDILFLGMECEGAPLSWLYGPLITRRLPRSVDQSRRLSGSNFRRGIDIVRRFDCKHVYVYAMGQEPWLNYVMSKKYAADSGPIVESDALLADCAAHGVVAERLFGEKEILLH
jgi:L-ascorbate metabolism protein UlaG (beta-lactamase superfamily)